MGIERRKLRRYFKRIPALFACGRIQGRGYVRNVSKEGLFLSADRLPPPRAEIQITVESPGGDKIEIQGRVMWTTAELPNAKEVQPGFGVLVEDTELWRSFFEAILVA